MDMPELHAAILAPVDRLGQILRAQEVVNFLNQAGEALAKMPALDSATARVAVLEERLKKAGEREEAARKEWGEREVALRREAAERVNGVLGQLGKAMADVEAARQEAADLRAQVEELTGRIAGMRTHPEVRRAERERLARELAALQEQHAALADPEPPPAQADPEPAPPAAKKKKTAAQG